MTHPHSPGAENTRPNEGRDNIDLLIEGLTEAQRKALIAFWPPYGAGMWPLRNALARKGLTEGFGNSSLTDLGLTVRSRLLQTTKESERG
jgi:hypothetical protein